MTENFQQNRINKLFYKKILILEHLGNNKILEHKRNQKSIFGNFY